MKVLGSVTISCVRSFRAQTTSWQSNYTFLRNSLDISVNSTYMNNLTLSLRFLKLKWKNLSVIEEERAIFLFRKKIKRVRSRDSSFCSVIETRPSTRDPRFSWPSPIFIEAITVAFSLAKPRNALVTHQPNFANSMILRNKSDNNSARCSLFVWAVRCSLWNIACVLSNQWIKFWLIVYE